MSSQVAVLIVMALIPHECRAQAENAESMALSDCIQFALEHHPRIHGARADEKGAVARITQARAPGRWRIEADAGYSNVEPAPGNQRKLAATVSASKLLYDSGRTAAQVAQSGKLREASVCSLRGTELDVAFATAQAYYEVLKARDLVAVAEEQHALAARHLEIAGVSYEAGTVARADVIRGEVTAASRRLSVIEAQTAEETAVAALINAMGMEAGAPLEVAGVRDEIAAPPDLPQAMATALDRRPELRQLGAVVASAEASVRAARTGRRPQVVGRGEWGVKDDTFPPTDRAWALGVTASVALFDGGDTRGRVAEAKAQLDASLAETHEVEQRIALEVTNGWLTVRAALESMAVAEEHVRLARHNMDVTEGRYRVGEVRLIEVTDAQTALAEALTNQTQATYNYEVAQATLRRAMGLLPDEGLSF